MVGRFLAGSLPRFSQIRFNTLSSTTQCSVASTTKPLHRHCERLKGARQSHRIRFGDFEIAFVAILLAAPSFAKTSVAPRLLPFIRNSEIRIPQSRLLQSLRSFAKTPSSMCWQDVCCFILAVGSWQVRTSTPSRRWRRCRRARLAQRGQRPLSEVERRASRERTRTPDKPRAGDGG